MSDIEPKILFFTSGHSPFSSRLFFLELKSLKKKYRNLAIIAPFDKKYQFKEDIQVIGIRKRKSRYNRFKTLYDLYQEGLEYHPDIIHCHEPDSLFVAFLLRHRIANVKIIYDCHEFHPYSFTENLPYPFRRLFKNIIEMIENFMATRADGIVTVNNRLGQRFKKINEKVVILPNYPSKVLFEKEGRSRKYLSSGVIHLIYAGGLSIERGIYKMVDIIDGMKDYFNCRLILVGRFSSKDLEKSFWEYVAKVNLSDRIEYKGYLPYKETVQHLINADIGLCLLDGRPRYHWTEPIKYFEYSAAGLPIIISDLEDMKKLVNKNKNGYAVSFFSPQQATDAIKKIIKNKDQAMEMGLLGKKAFLKNYNWEAIEHRLFDLYATLVGRDYAK